MKRTMKWLLVVAAITVVISGCSSEGTSEQPPVQPPAAEPPVTEPPAAEPPAKQPPEEAKPAEIKVTTGSVIELETMIEGMAEKVEVTEYKLEPYGISYHLRTAMGEPTVEEGQAVYKSQMGDDVGIIALQVLENSTLDEAAAALQKQYEADGFKGGAAQDTSTEVTTLQGKHQSFEGDGYFIGYNVYALGDHAFAIKYRYPFEAGDGMAAVQTELVTSLKQ